MQPDDQSSPARRWLALADQDLDAAIVLLNDGSVALRIVGFLAQQAAEKSLKAGLYGAGINDPEIHGLRQLWLRYPENHSPAIAEDDLDSLDPWAIDGRHAADLPDIESAEAEKLLTAALRVVAAVKALHQPG